MQWRHFPRIALCVLLFAHILAHVDRNMLLGFSPQIIRDIGLSNAQYGFLVGAVWVLSFGLMAMFMGTLADRYSRPRVVAVGMLVWSVCTWASGNVHDFTQMAMARFFVASGEAALVPAAVSLLADLFPARRRGTVIGIFFTGIPLGIGFSFLLAGTYGETHGWRDTFHALGVIGALLALPLACLSEERGQPGHERGAPFGAQLRALARTVRNTPGLLQVIAGFVLLHMVFAGFAFTQVWLVDERGLDAAAMAKRIGMLQLVFGTIGAVFGGGLGDRFAHVIKGGHAGFVAALVVLCAPFMLAYRFAAPGSALFYLGMCAGAFLPMAAYGPANTLIQGMVPATMRSTVAGFTMMAINVVAISLGSLAVGAGRDLLAGAGVASPFTAMLLATDVLAIASVVLFAGAARRGTVVCLPAAIRSH
ncbi:MFS transporter [Duganella sp. FT3S]|uniref:MFS transporter n=1 Tax=Rugamonas fusca TaxID=2758568 RepID=A0A7W2EM61_9BURK|nr:MFS transporter [Rugamonas fusca]MBA5608469.1 MFS transporter [Rugamonas fusca]